MAEPLVIDAPPDNAPSAGFKAAPVGYPRCGCGGAWQNDRGGWENRQCVGVAMTPIEITAEGHR